MRENNCLTCYQVRQVLDYNPTTGELTWRHRGGRGARTDLAGKVAGSPHKDGYVAVQIGRKKYLAHRLIWLHVHGHLPAGEIDHRNMLKADNRLVNLRDVTRGVNLQNKPLRNGRLGVDYSKSAGKWRARIGVAGVSKSLGYFKDAASAQEAYLSAKRILHEGNML